MTPSKAALLRAAAEYLAAIGATEGSFLVAVTDADGEEHRVPCRTWQQAAAAPFAAAAGTIDAPSALDAPAMPSAQQRTARRGRGREFSPRAEKILLGLRGRGWLTAGELAESIGEECDNDLRALLRDLEAREYVEIHQRYGVRLILDEQSTSGVSTVTDAV